MLSDNHENLNRVTTDSLRARQIVDEILHFGVNQDQLKTIIRLLALELEDICLMKVISTNISESNETNEKSEIIL